jgi:hypothetical protein
MTHRLTMAFSALAILSCVPLAAQTPAPKTTPAKTAAAKTGKAWSAPRAPDGHPDLQGVWSYITATSFETPGGIGNIVYRMEESDNPVGNYNQLFYDARPTTPKDRPPSQVIYPPDGHLPPMTAAGIKRQAAYAARTLRPAEGPEDRPLFERCLLGFNTGPPIVPGGYNQHLQIFETPGTVALYTEMIHSTRVVPRDGRPHGTVRQWNGDPRGHWEGDTLVVDSTNFTEQGTGTLMLPVPMDEHLHLTERYSLLDGQTLLYQYTVDDSSVWTKPWTAQVYMTRADEQLYEYACHEGNYAMPGILAGARLEEKKSAGK